MKISKAMNKVTIKETQNPTILKFEFQEFITQNESFEFKNIDEAKTSPLAQQLFYLPFVKTIYISGNFIAIEKYSIVEWEDVKDAVAEQIEKFVADGGIIITIDENKTKKKPVTVYGESTPNPAALKFVVSKMLTRNAIEFKNIDQTAASPLAKELFKFPYVKEIFIDENYISVTKYEINEWQEITLELRSFIKQYIENGGTVLDENYVATVTAEETIKAKEFDNLDVTSQQIINILEEYVKHNSYFDSECEIDEDGDETILFTTRKNGLITAEIFSMSDYWAGGALKKIWKCFTEMNFHFHLNFLLHTL